MHWGCSDRSPADHRRLIDAPHLGRVIGVVALVMVGAFSRSWASPRAGVSADQAQWRLGVFPVMVFSGYTSFFGSRTGPWGAVEPHYGLDIAAPMGSAVRNWWGGTVTAVIADDRCGVGLQIRSGNYEHIYCHLLGSSTAGLYRCGALEIRTGQRVRTGQLIGRIGMSGRTTGPHLHWGLRYDGQWLNPVRILQAMAQSRRITPQG